MKNTFKILSLGLVMAALTSCYSGTPSGKLDSVANNATDTGTSTTVDTMNRGNDTTKTDSTK